MESSSASPSQFLFLNASLSHPCLFQTSTPVYIHVSAAVSMSAQAHVHMAVSRHEANRERGARRRGQTERESEREARKGGRWIPKKAGRRYSCSGEDTAAQEKRRGMILERKRAGAEGEVNFPCEEDGFQCILCWRYT